MAMYLIDIKYLFSITLRDAWRNKLQYVNQRDISD